MEGYFPVAFHSSPCHSVPIMMPRDYTCPDHVSRFLIGIFVTLGMSVGLRGQSIYENNFDHYEKDQIYTPDHLDLDWFFPGFEKGVEEGRVAIVTGPQAFRHRGASLAVLYPEGGSGTKLGGALWKLELPGSYKAVRLRYRVKFAEGFDFVRGGKLPGLAGGIAPTGSDQADGTNGWTGRMMWRTDYDGLPGEEPQNRANMVTYLKHTQSGFDQDGTQEDNLYWTDDIGDPIEIQAGVWYRITQWVKMNKIGRSNGRLKMFLNGTQVLDQRDLVFRTTDDLGIDVMYFNTFFGGSGPLWAPSKDEVIYFDDFEIEVTAP